MNYRLFLPLLSGCLSLLFPAQAQADALPDKAGRQYIEFETVVPSELQPLQMENPVAVFIIEMDQDGNLRESMAIEATHFKLLKKAEQKLQETDLKDLTGGDASMGPRQFFVAIRFFDPNQRAWKRGLANLPMGSSASDAAARRMYELSKRDYVFNETLPGDLDKPLQLIESKLVLIHEPDKPMQKGKVLVEYFVDYKGTVCFPDILHSDHDSLALSVLKTLENTRFVPPLKRGRPTFVKVRQPFNFD